jgi:hypothetical protein
MSLTEAAFYPAEISDAAKGHTTVYRIGLRWNIETDELLNLHRFHDYRVLAQLKDNSISIKRKRR